MQIYEIKVSNSDFDKARRFLDLARHEAMRRGLKVNDLNWYEDGETHVGMAQVYGWKWKADRYAVDVSGIISDLDEYNQSFVIYSI